jgi:hypothetical protein
MDTPETGDMATSQNNGLIEKIQADTTDERF